MLKQPKEQEEKKRNKIMHVLHSSYLLELKSRIKLNKKSVNFSEKSVQWLKKKKQ